MGGGETKTTSETYKNKNGERKKKTRGKMFKEFKGKKKKNFVIKIS